mmetsp:Transcript_452/g.269  ORF Transcript_452/g.269 Transcript_452/m.269 type:complete len:94 (-) Transcript_452:455-736(-)
MIFTRDLRHHAPGGGAVENNEEQMKKCYTAVIERCRNTGFYVGYIPCFKGAHSQAKTLDELNRNLQEVLEMLLEDGEPIFESEFIGTQNVVMA